MKNIVEIYQEWKQLPKVDSVFPPITFGGDMKITERLDELEGLRRKIQTVGAEKAVSNHLAAIRTHIEAREATIEKTVAELFDAIEAHVIFYYDGIGDDKLFPLLDAIKKHIEEQEAVIAKLNKACKAAIGYYRMLEKATGIEHGCLKLLRAAIAKADGENE